MALGGVIRGRKTTLRLPAEADLARFNDWMADLRVRSAHPVWHEPAMPATWKERFLEIAKEPLQILWSIETQGALVGLVAGSMWGAGGGFSLRQLVIDPAHRKRSYAADAALALHRYLFDYLDLRRTDIVVHADNAAALRVADRLGYVEYARGHDVYYRDGAYVDELQLLMDVETWRRRWGATEREYAPLPAEAFR